MFIIYVDFFLSFIHEKSSKSPHILKHTRFLSILEGLALKAQLWCHGNEERPDIQIHIKKSLDRWAMLVPMKDTYCATQKFNTFVIYRPR